jgi:hypothetical protein
MSQVRYRLVFDAKNGMSSSVVPDMKPAGMIKRSDVSSLNPNDLMIMGMKLEENPVSNAGSRNRSEDTLRRARSR